MIDWTRYIDANRERLLAVLAALVAMVDGANEVSRWVHSMVLASLLLVEASTRRLIAVLARDLVIAPRATKGKPSWPILTGEDEGRVPAFPLFDPRQCVDPKTKRTKGKPRARTPGEWYPPEPEKSVALPDDKVSAAALHRRLAALAVALGDLRKQARRMARKLAAHPRYQRAMRPGRPPGYRKNGKREIDDILADCHDIAMRALAELEGFASIWTPPARASP